MQDKVIISLQKLFSVRTSCVEADATNAKLTDLLIEAFEALMNPRRYV